MRMPAPVAGAIGVVRYREIHSALPLIMNIFMFCARTFIWLLFLIISIAIMFFVLRYSQEAGAIIAVWIGVLYFIGTGFYSSRVDIFFVPGFVLFSRLLGERP